MQMQDYQCAFRDPKNLFMPLNSHFVQCRSISSFCPQTLILCNIDLLSLNDHFTLMDLEESKDKFESIVLILKLRQTHSCPYM